MHNGLVNLIRHVMILSIRERGVAMTALDSRYRDIFYKTPEGIGCHALTSEEIRKEEEFYHRRKQKDEIYYLDNMILQN